MMDTIIKHVQILDQGIWRCVDLGIEGGKLVALEGALSGPSRSELNGKGAYLLPGAVDLHVHFNEPGRTHWEGFATGSAAAAAGGVTTLAEMPLNSIPSTVSVAALETKLAAVGSKSHVDFALWGGVVPGNAEELVPLAEAGVMGFKAFMSPSGTDDFINSNVTTLREAMRRIAPTGLRLALHAEDPEVLARAAKAQTSKVSAFDWESSRPVAAEVSAVRIAIDLAVETGCPLTIVHVSSAEVLAVIDAAKIDGVEVVAETCPHYLLLSLNDADRIGTRAKCAPPLRPTDVVDGLRQAVRAGRIDTIGSDHSPSSPDLKEGLSFYDAWGGISGLQHGLPLMIDLGGVDDLDWMQTVQTTFASKPAKIAGFADKGSLVLGQDADFSLVVSDVEGHWVHETDLLYRHPLTAYVGMMQRTVVQSTWLRGQCIFRDGKMVSKPIGRFLKMGSAYG